MPIVESGDRRLRDLRVRRPAQPASRTVDQLLLGRDAELAEDRRQVVAHGALDERHFCAIAGTRSPATSATRDVGLAAGRGGERRVRPGRRGHRLPPQRTARDEQKDGGPVLGRQEQQLHVRSPRTDSETRIGARHRAPLATASSSVVPQPGDHLGRHEVDQPPVDEMRRRSAEQIFGVRADLTVMTPSARSAPTPRPSPRAAGAGSGGVEGRGSRKATTFMPVAAGRRAPTPTAAPPCP